MDFPTRNLYRSAIEGLARGSKLTELEIARATLIAAADPKHQACREDDGVGSREHDPGYHLIAGGRPTFERTVGFRAPLRSWLVRCHTKIGIAGYIGGVIIVAAIVLLLPSIALGEPRIGGWSLGLLAVLGLIPSIDLAVAIVNRVVTSGFGTTILPGLELRDGVTSNLRTMVAVPTLLTTQAALEEQIERLEIHT
jgi:cyclic beta-1,2-glucan synthetase